MAPVDIRDLEREFVALTALAPDARAERLERIALDHPSLARALQALLKADTRYGDFLAEPAHAALEQPIVDAPPAHDDTLDAAVSSDFGTYTVVEPIGEGGFGSVYLALQTAPVRRSVAIKFLRLPRDAVRDLVAFRRERQALALLDHPHIARLLDAGITPAGRPFFVLDLVRGSYLTEFCDARRLSITDRLRLFLEVCDAVHYAHTMGVVHRDLKPRNILVTTRDGAPTIKVIDFGIATATIAAYLDSSASSFSLLGTPAYCSPEHALGGDKVGARSDIYCLGAVLFELLSGIPPVQPDALKNLDLAALRERIQHPQVPPLDRVLDLHSASTARACEARQCTPPELRRHLASDVRWIVSRAMALSPADRYQSAADLARDIERFLRHEPLSAAPPVRTYFLRKFVERNRAVVAISVSSMLVLLLLCIALAIASLSATRRSRELALETRRANDASLLAQQREAEAVAAGAEARRLAYVSSIGAAGAAWTMGEGARLRTVLDACEPALRGWEWNFLDRQADASLAELARHSRPVRCVAISPDGRLVASGALDEGAIIHDLSGERPNIKAGTNRNEIRSVEFDPTSRRVLLADTNGLVQMFDATDGAPVLGVRAHDRGIDRATFSPDGASILTAPYDGRPVVLDASTGAIRHTLLGHDAGVSWACFSPNGAFIATSSLDKTARTWDASTGAPRLVLSGDAPLNRIAIDPTSSYISTGAHNGAVEIWSAATGTRVASWHVHGRVIYTLVHSHDASMLAAASQDGSVSIMRLPDSPPMRIMSGADSIRDVLFSRDDSELITAGDDGTIRIFDIATGRCTRSLLCPAGRITQLGEHHTRPVVVGGTSSGSVRMWPIGPDAASLFRHADQVRACVPSPDQRTILTAGLDNVARRWDATTGELLTTYAAHRGHVWDARFSPDGKLVATSSSDATAIVYDLTRGTPIATFRHADRVRSVAFSSDSTRVLTGSIDTTARIWDIASSREVLRLTGHTGRIEGAYFTRDDAGIFTHSTDGTARIWNSKTGECRFVLRHSDAEIRAAGLSPDGRQAATASADSTTRLWDVATGALLQTFEGHTSALKSLAFSRDGRLLATGSDDRTARVWSCDSGRMIANLGEQSHSVYAVAFDATGTRLFLGTRDGAIRLYDIASSRELFTLGSDFNAIFNLTVTPDGNRLLAACGDGGGRIWDATPRPPHTGPPPGFPHQ